MDVVKCMQFTVFTILLGPVYVGGSGGGGGRVTTCVQPSRWLQQNGERTTRAILSVRHNTSVLDQEVMGEEKKPMFLVVGSSRIDRQGPL